jgi:hypothetical protein
MPKAGKIKQEREARPRKIQYGFIEVRLVYQTPF